MTVSPDHEARRQVLSLREFWLSIFVAAFLTLSCGGNSNALTVFAASSMTDFIEELLIVEKPPVGSQKPLINTAGSGTLLLQIDEGANADLVVLAGAAHMKQLMASNDFLPATPFAATHLSIILSPDLRHSGVSFSDLWSGDLQGAMCVRSAPCGQLAASFGSAKGVNMEGLSREPNVRAVLAKVEHGDVDFGFVYKTDFLSSDAEVTEVPGAGAQAFSTTYYLAISKEAKDIAELRTMVDRITGKAGREVLMKLGFMRP